MTIVSRSEVILILRKFTHGEISCGELHRYMFGQRVALLDELLSRIGLQDRDYMAIALSRDTLRERIEGFLNGDVSFQEFQLWACHLYQIHVGGDYRHSEVYCSQIECTLMLLSLCMDTAVTESPRASRALVGKIHGTLVGKRGQSPEAVLSQLYTGKRMLHLVTHRTVPDSFCCSLRSRIPQTLGGRRVTFWPWWIRRSPL